MSAVTSVLGMRTAGYPCPDREQRAILAQIENSGLSLPSSAATCHEAHPFCCFFSCLCDQMRVPQLPLLLQLGNRIIFFSVLAVYVYARDTHFPPLLLLATITTTTRHPPLALPPSPSGCYHPESVNGQEA